MGVMMDLKEKIFTTQTHMTFLELLGPVRTPPIQQGFSGLLGPPRNIRTPQSHLRTASGPLNIPSLLMGHLRTLQDPSGPLRVLFAPQDITLLIAWYDLILTHEPALITSKSSPPRVVTLVIPRGMSRD